MTTPTYDGLTADQWREKSAESSRRSYESFERSDTDGFLSQWASDTMAREYQLCARLAEQDGYWEFAALFDLDGNLLPAALRTNQWGDYWMIFDNPDLRGRPIGFFTESKARKAATRNRNNAKKGYSVGLVRKRGSVTAGSSGSWSVYHYVEAVDEFDPHAEIVRTTQTIDY